MIAGQYITDGTAVFIIRDIRDGIPVGKIFTDSFLRDSCVKINGAEVQRNSYTTIVELMKQHPELVTTEALWPSNKHLFTWGVGGTATTGNTIRLPDLRDRYVQLSDSTGILAAGLPNIKGDTAQTGLTNCNGTYGTGALRAVITSGSWGATGNGAGGGKVTLDASLHNSIYRDNVATVLPETVKHIAQMKY